jgi:polyhydroxybutyrate depolymerase
VKVGRALGAMVLGVAIAGAATRACAKRDQGAGGPPPIPTPTTPTTRSVPVHSARIATAPGTSATAAAGTAKPDESAPSISGPPGTPGCGTAQASPRGVSYETRDKRTFHVWGPTTYDASRPYPVVLTFHGWYANGRAFESWFKMEDHVDGAAFTVYPDSKGPTWDITGSIDIDFAADVIEAMSNAYCIDRAHVFAFGFSYGGKLVHHLGCKRPGLVRAISVGDGSWASDTGCRPIPVLVTHRTRDHDELVAWGKDAAKRWAKIDGCAETTDVTDAAHGCVAHRGCAAPNTVTFCEDAHFDPAWPKDWNHTVREEYRSLTWKWFMSVP